MFKRWGIFFFCMLAAFQAPAQEPPVPEPEVLNASVVRADNSYIRNFLRRLDQSLSQNDPDNAPDWHSLVYTKIEMDVANIEDILDASLIKKNLGFVQDYARTSAHTGKTYIPAILSENLSDQYHSGDPSFNREVVRANRISGFTEGNPLQQFTGSAILKTNFYKSSIGIFNLSLPNPAAASSHLFYNYYLVDSLQVEGRKTYVLRFHPKKLVTSPTLDGEMLIDAQDYGIRRVNASLSRNSSVNWIRHIDIDVRNRRLSNGRWFYGEESLVVELSVTPNDDASAISLQASRNTHYGLPHFAPLPDRDLLQSRNPVSMSSAIQGDDAFWRNARPFPLSPHEQGIYDMVARVQAQPFYKWTYTILDTVISGYYEIPAWKIELGRWARTFSHNDMEGFRVQLGGRTLYTFSQKLRLSGYMAYGFKDRKPKGQAQVEWQIGRERTRKLTTTYKEDYEWLGSGTGVFSAPNMFSNILMRTDGNRRTFVRTGDILYQHEFTPSLNAEIQWTSQRMWSSPTVPIYSVDGTHSVLESMDVHQLSVGVRLSFDEKVLRNYFKKTYLYSKYPVLAVGVSGGFKGISTNDFNFVRTYASLRWRFPSTAIGYGDLNINGGIIWGSVPHTLLKQHKGNTTYYTDKTAFSCMDAYEFASDRWLEGYYEHNFNGFFLGKIPWIKKLDLREVATVRFAWGDLSDRNKQNTLQETGVLTMPYVETGVGITNILSLFRVDCFWRLTHLQSQAKKNFSINVGIDIAF